MRDRQPSGIFVTLRLPNSDRSLQPQHGGNASQNSALRERLDPVTIRLIEIAPGLMPEDQKQRGCRGCCGFDAERDELRMNQ